MSEPVYFICRKCGTKNQVDKSNDNIGIMSELLPGGRKSADLDPGKLFGLLTGKYIVKCENCGTTNSIRI